MIDQEQDNEKDSPMSLDVIDKPPLVRCNRCKVEVTPVTREKMKTWTKCCLGAIALIVCSPFLLFLAPLCGGCENCSCSGCDCCRCRCCECKKGSKCEKFCKSFDECINSCCNGLERCVKSCLAGTEQCLIGCGSVCHLFLWMWEEEKLLL